MLVKDEDDVVSDEVVGKQAVQRHLKYICKDI